jgi:hypothetical protein
MRGRKAPGPEFVQRLTGADHEKERLAVILQTLTGTLSIEGASARLGITPQRFHVLRERAMQAALASLAAQPLGRPRQAAGPEQERIDALTQDNERLRRELAAWGLREEIALVLAGQHDRGEKKRGAGGRRDR